MLSRLCFTTLHLNLGAACTKGFQWGLPLAHDAQMRWKWLLQPYPA